ncbi:MAG: hypothetical protein AAGD28_01825 [Bacteroidota bacterium]
MKFLLRTISIAFLAFIGLRFFDWWIIVVIALAVGVIMSEKRPRRLFGKKKAPAYAFLSGFLAIALVWGAMSWWLDSQNASLLSQKIFELLSGGASSAVSPAWAMIGLTACTGGLLGGFSSMTGNLLGEAIKN